MDSSESLHLDEHLARLLAAYDHRLDDADGHAATIDVRPLLPGERIVEPLSGSDVNHGSLHDLLPDAPRVDPFILNTAPVPEIHRVGRFELRKQLGRGGCGIVFLAHDPKLKRDVALKIPRPELMMSPDARKRLVREATAAAAFDHPNLVPVYETGEIGPVCFIASVFCPGITLSEWLDRQAFPVPIRQTARLVAQLAEAVQHAHDRGVLHRDLKPNNVILQEVKSDPNQQDAPPGACPLRGDYFIPRVVDFGLAKLADSGPGETATRQVLGTPKYMAPEQAQARHEDVGPEADVYALGGILYEMLTGRAPYEGATDVEVLRQCIDGNLTPPRHLRNEIPRDLEAICLKAMARVPARRYRTSIDLADDLRRFLDGLPTLARPLNGIGRASRWLRRNDQLFALITVTTISVVLLASGSWNAYQTQLLQTSHNEAQLKEADRQREEHARDADRHVRDAYHLWRTGQQEPMARALLEARYAFGLAGVPQEFATGFLLNRSRQMNEPVGGSPPQTRSVALSPNGAWLATDHADGAIRIWSYEPLRVIETIREPAAPERLHFSRENRLATPTRAWNIDTAGRAARSPRDPQADASPRSKFTASVRDGTIEVTEADGRVVVTLFGADDPVREAVVSPDGRHVAALMDEKTLGVWELATGRQRMHRFPAVLHECVFSPKGDRLFLAAEDGLHRMNPGRDPAGEAFEDRPAAVSAVSFAIKGDAFAASDAEGRLESFTGRDTGPVLYDAAGRRAITAIRYNIDGVPLGVECGEHHVSVWSFDGSPRRILHQPVRAVSADLSPEGDSVAVGDSQGRVSVWSLPAGEKLGEIDTHRRGAVYGLSFSTNGRWLAVPLEGTAVGLWFVGETTIPLKVAGHPEGTTRFRFLGDDRLATAGRSCSVKVWNLQSMREEFTMLGHAARVTCFAASPDLRTLVSGSADGEVRFWDLRTGLETLTMKRHRGPVLAAEFNAAGNRLLTGSAFRGRGELAFWNADKE
ncbi:MAG: WD40 repeat domain-containing serine/threonine protein kinase [Gemmataceae bacterium]